MNDVSQAVTILRNGGLVAIPTETVYGLGADARNDAALRKIFQAKQRPIDHPLIVHVADMTQLAEWVSEVPPMAKQLAQAFWPGPLTLIFKKAAKVSNLVTGGQETVGIRIPSHPVALELLKAYGGGLAAPSANRYGRISPTTSEAVREELGDAVDMVLEGGQCEVGLESTIVDVSGEQPVVLRPGMITTTEIEAVLHQMVSKQKKDAPRVSGSHESHYAPVTTTHLMTTEQLVKLTLTEKDGVIGFAKSQSPATSIVMSSNPKVYAHDLYQALRDLDKRKLSQIIIERVPEGGEWDAIRDRLQRAAS